MPVPVDDGEAAGERVAVGVAAPEWEGVPVAAALPLAEGARDDDGDGAREPLTDGVGSGVLLPVPVPVLDGDGARLPLGEFVTAAD